VQRRPYCVQRRPYCVQRRPFRAVESMGSLGEITGRREYVTATTGELTGRRCEITGINK
jgi:hypothetical protein